MTGLRRPLVWLRHRRLRDDDVFLASYPRSGSTWLRFLLHELLTEEASEFGQVDQALPDVGAQMHAPVLLGKSGRLIKTHEPFRPRYLHAVYLVRDPRDVLLSEYQYMRLHRQVFDGSLPEFVEAFLRGRVNPFGSWNSHVTGWLAARSSRPLLLVRYEHLRANPEPVLHEIASFLSVDVPRERLLRAIANNGLQQMRAKEGTARSMGRLAEGPGAFVGAGQSGSWRDQLPRNQVIRVEGELGETLALCGYELSL